VADLATLYRVGGAVLSVLGVGVLIGFVWAYRKEIKDALEHWL
jgi:hypothetical protein